MTMELSIEQRCAVQQFEEGDNLFITGEGGTGKTTLIQYLIRSARKRNKTLQICAMTGCAALLLNCNAKTIHSWSGIRLAKGDAKNVVHSVLYSSAASKVWKSVQILVIDEVSMMSKRLFDILNEIGRRVRQNSRPFGGIQVVFCGDFYQLPPVASSMELDSDKFCFESNDWYTTFPLENHIVLDTIFRQTDPHYKNILTRLRKGNIDSESIAVLKSRVGLSFDKSNHNGCVPTKLFPTRNKVDFVNQKMFELLAGDPYEYTYICKSNCTVYMDSIGPIPIPIGDLKKCRKLLNEEKIEHTLNYLLTNSPCVKQLQLKKGTVVMCTVNLDLENGICNGSTGIVEDFVLHAGIPFPIVRFTNGHKREIPIKYWQSEDYPTIAIGQFPLCHAWAITIHKMQGATLALAEMDIGNNVFEYGQTYVALSRVKSLDGLYLTGFDSSKIKVNPKVKEFYNLIPEVEYEDEESEAEDEAVAVEVAVAAAAVEDDDIKKITLNDDRPNGDLCFESYAYTDLSIKKIEA